MIENPHSTEIFETTKYISVDELGCRCQVFHRFQKKKGDFEKEIPEIYRKFFLEISVCVAGPASHTL